MDKVKLIHSSRDTLLLAFSNAKVGVVISSYESYVGAFSYHWWSMILNLMGLKTISMHQFEEDELRVGHMAIT